jgi:hypothetical protein
MNKEINGKQCTVLWHVDDVKISHESVDVVTEMIDLHEMEFGKEALLSTTRVKVHEYLGMTQLITRKWKSQVFNTRRCAEHAQQYAG